MTEGEIRLLIGESKKDGFKALFKQYQAYVYSIVWGRIKETGTIEDAEECISDVFSEVFIHFDEIQTGSLKAYIGTVAKRMAIRKYHKLSSKNADISEIEEYQEIPDNMNLEDDFIKKEEYQKLYDKINSLGEPDMTIIVQKYFYERKQVI